MGARSVLVVDDDKLLCWALRKELSAHDLDVDTATNGAEALDSLRRRSYDLAFLDIQLPDGNGLDLLAPFREASPRTRVFILSGRGTAPDKRRAFREGAVQFIEKPFEMASLVNLLKSSLDDHRVRRAHERFVCRLPLRLAIAAPTPEDVDLDLTSLGATALDAGAAGLRIQTDFPLRSGQWVEVTVLRGEDPCACFVPPGARAQVVWTRAQGTAVTAGLAYEKPVTPDRIS